MNSTLSETILTGINNPECSFLVGTIYGGGLLLKYLIFLFVLVLISKAFDKLAFTPLIDWIKKKIYKK